jgi:acyl-CoA synthetase (NDP forming)
VDHLTRLGIGISSFASVGNKLDVSSNDMLMWWERDGQTRVAVLYIESFGNPRKFARTARRVGARIPVITVHAGRSEAGQRAAATHTSSTATPLVTREALFEQAGIIATPSFGELMGATALLATQPPPVGRTVAIVSNVGGAGVLAADACTDLGLTVHHPHGETERLLRALIPDGGSVTGPVDTVATVSADHFRQALEVLTADEDVHAIIALVLPTGATGDLVAAIGEADVGVPLAAVLLDQAESVRLLPRTGRGGQLRGGQLRGGQLRGGQLRDGQLRDGRVPAYGYPEAAVAALARAAMYGAWRAEPRGRIPDFPGIETSNAAALTRGFLGQTPDGGWLPPEQVAALLRCYEIPLAGDEGDLTTTGLTGVAAQPDGISVIVRVTADHTFGPLVVFGLGGVASDVFADRSARLTPLTDTDADSLIRSVRSASLLLGGDGRPAVDLGALRDLLLRVSRLADDLPEVTDLDLDPVIARPGGAAVADARIKIAPYEPQDPFLRRLR